ncbi:MAG: amidohydrolase family protein [Acidobacteriota bacterium]
MYRITFYLVFIAVLVSGCRSGGLIDQATETVFAFVEVNVIPMDSERVVENQTVIIRDGRIAELGDSAKIKIPDDATRIDGRGKYLMPGLADMHAHVQSEGELLLMAAHGVTTIRDMFGSPYKTVWRDRIARGEMFGPTIYTAGPIVDGFPPNASEMSVVKTAEDAEPIIARQKQRGYDFIKVYHTLSKEAYDAILLAAKKHAIPVAGHVTAGVGLAGALRSGQKCIEHLDSYTFALQREGSPYLGYSTIETRDDKSWMRSINFVDESKIPALARATRDAGVWNCPTLIAYRDWGLTQEETRERVKLPEMKYVHPLLMAQWSPENKEEIPYSDSIESNGDAMLMKRRVEVHKKLTKALNDAGAGILLGTDAGVPFAIPGLSALEELELLVSAGLTPYEAIKTGTRNAAQYLNASNEFGAVAAGKRADLILLEDNPLKDISNARRRAGVMLRGQWLTESELRRRLDELAQGYKAQKDWFETMPGLPTEGSREFFARYAITSLGLPKGEERIAIEGLSDGRRAVVSQFSAEEPEEKFFTRMEIDEAAGRNTLVVESDGREGKGSIEFRQENKRLSVKGKMPVAGDVRSDEDDSYSVLLNAPGIASSVWLYEKVKSMAAGQTMTLRVKEWDFGPAFDLSQRTWKVKRQPDLKGSGSAPLRVYEIEVSGAIPLYTSRLTIDERGWPFALEVRQGEELIRYRRIQ